MSVTNQTDYDKLKKGVIKTWRTTLIILSVISIITVLANFFSEHNSMTMSVYMSSFFVSVINILVLCLANRDKSILSYSIFLIVCTVIYVMLIAVFVYHIISLYDFVNQNIDKINQVIYFFPSTFIIALSLLNLNYCLIWYKIFRHGYATISSKHSPEKYNNQKEKEQASKQTLNTNVKEKDTIQSKLQELKNLLENDLISKSEYDTMRAKVLENLLL